jgi:hypothetical protein
MTALLLHKREHELSLCHGMLAGNTGDEEILAD